MTPLDKKVSLGLIEEGRVLGRIVGTIDAAYRSLKIEAFSVEPGLRGKGVGTRLIEAIERVGADQRCSVVFVETVSFSAPEFYEKQGYALLGKLDDFPMPGVSNLWFYKRL